MLDVFPCVAPKTMVVRIRLSRFGRRHQPFYNIVVCQARYVPNSGFSIVALQLWAKPYLPSQFPSITQFYGREILQSTGKGDLIFYSWTDPLAIPNRSKFSEPTILSRKNLLVWVIVKPKLRSLSRILHLIGQGRNIGLVLGHNLAILCGDYWVWYVIMLCPLGRGFDLV